MKLSDLKQATEQIQLDDISRQRMIKELRTGRRNHRGYGRVTRIAATAAVCVLAVGLVSIPVRALVSSLVQERMEELPKEEVKQIVEQTDDQPVEADSFSREYTAAEEDRWGELYTQYMNGTFPEGELLQVDSEDEAKTHDFCYLTTISKFYLPEGRDLTDEELLQIIDFNQKRDYALAERSKEERAEEIAAEEKKEKEQIAQNIAEGGITEQEAIDIAAEYLQKLFGTDGNGMEFNHYFCEAGDIYDEATYNVNWSIQSHDHYYFNISADTGKLVGVVYSGDGRRRLDPSERPGADEAPAIAASIKEQAATLLKDMFGIDETYEKVESCYYTWGDGNVGNGVRIVFLKADGSAYSLSYGWEGDFWEYFVTTKERYEEDIELMLKYLPEELTRDTGEKVDNVKVVRE